VALKAHRDCVVNEGYVDYAANRVSKANVVSVEHKAHAVKRENAEFKAHRDYLASKVNKGHQDHRGHRVVTVVTDLVVVVHLGHKGHLGLKGLKAHKENLDKV
jgi:hypothetical protein